MTKTGNFDIVEEILLVDSTDNYKLYAKTGTTARVEKAIGWWVGFVKNKNGVWLFAINIDLVKDEDAEQRKVIANEILDGEGII